MADGERNGKDWRELCVAASQEPDSERLAFLIQQILEAFDRSDPDFASTTDS